MSSSAASRALFALSRRIYDSASACTMSTSSALAAASAAQGATTSLFFESSTLAIGSALSTAAARCHCRRRRLSTSSISSFSSDSSPSDSSSSSTVISETSSSSKRDIPQGVALLTVDRPKQLNALSSRVMRDLTSAALAADADPRVRAIVVAGEGKAFAAGADVKELAGITHDEVRRCLSFFV